MSKKDLAKFSEEVFRLMPFIVKGIHKRERDMLGVGQITVPQFLLLSFLHDKNLMKMKFVVVILNGVIKFIYVQLVKPKDKKD